MTAPSASFDSEIAFLRSKGPVEILEAPSGGRVAISAKYQGRVMTSAVAANGASLGWINHALIASGKTGTAFDNYGGEDRFWLGPEGGQFSLYFAPKSPFTFDKWQTPPSFQEGTWAVAERAPGRILLTQAIKLSNYSGTSFSLAVTREVRLLSASEVAARLGAPVSDTTRWVAFETINRISNTGDTAWTKDKGLLSVWILGMYNPTPDTFVAVPFQKEGAGEIVNDRYFGKVAADRLQQDDGFLVFKCDGKSRGKIGLGPARATPVLGSYSESANLLTIVQYDKPKTATDYVNSMWEIQKNPYAGDVINSYNDGPTEPGKPSLGGFYEMETSSPAATLAPGASLVHTHRTFHIMGPRASLDSIAVRALGVSATRISAGITSGAR